MWIAKSLSLRAYSIFLQVLSLQIIHVSAGVGLRSDRCEHYSVVVSINGDKTRGTEIASFCLKCIVFHTRRSWQVSPGFSCRTEFVSASPFNLVVLDPVERYFERSGLDTLGRTECGHFDCIQRPREYFCSWSRLCRAQDDVAESG